MTQKTTRPRWRRMIDRAMLMLAGTLVALVIGEIVVRIGGFGPNIHPIQSGLFQLSDNPRMRYTLVPNTDLDGILINSHGFRGGEVSLRKAPNTFRIVCIGDSITFGHWVGQQETYSARLEQYLNETYATADRRFEVLNFGVTGYNIVQIEEMLRQRAIHYDPDLILYAYCLNDPQDFSREFDALYYQLNKAEARYRGYVLSRARRLTLRSRLFALARYTLDAATPEGQSLREMHRDPQTQNFKVGEHVEYFTGIHLVPPGKTRLEDGMAAIGSFARAHNTPVCLVLFPLFLDPEDGPLLAAHRKVFALAEKENFSIVDLTGPFESFRGDAFQSMHHDQLHPTAKGHAVAAVAILRELLTQGLLGMTEKDPSRLNSSKEPLGEIARHLASQGDGTPTR